MFPEDPVLVGVMNRRKDFELAQTHHWYRVPVQQAPKATYMQYIAFYFTRDFGANNGAIHYFAEIRGHERATRLQLLPDEPTHKNAEEEYHKLQLAELRLKNPPIINHKKRRLTFVYTTWDRFIHATTIDDLYSTADQWVDRIFYALKEVGYTPRRSWEWETGYPPQIAQVRILCEEGEVVATPRLENQGENDQHELADLIASIEQEIREKGGPKFLPIPIE